MKLMKAMAIIAIALMSAVAVQTCIDSADGAAGEKFDPSLTFDAEVTPFVFPDSGGIPVFDAISGAKKSVHIEMYLMTSSNMFGLLTELAQDGVEVVLLLEADPEGSSEQNASRLKGLYQAGAEVKLIGGVDRDRYNFVHAKYAIVDGETTVITSENWTTDNLNGKVRNNTYSSDYGNRGWGAVIESRQYAAYMEKIFQNDLDPSYGDVRDFSKTDEYAKATAKSSFYDAPKGTGFRSYHAKVCPMLSPDNSLNAQLYWIGESSARVYVQQQSIGARYQEQKNWTDADNPLHALNEAARAGADVRFMTSTTNGSMVDRLNSGSLIKAAAMSAPYLHNKGLVCDDVSIVASVNWTPNSFKDNREVGVAIVSGDVADYYAGVFERDFSKYYEYEGLSVSLVDMKKDYALGEKVTFRAVAEPAGEYSYEWSIGDGQVITTDKPSVTVTPRVGAHVLKVTVTGSDGQKATSSSDYAVVDPSSGSGDDSGSSEEGSGKGTSIWYIAIVVILAIAAAAYKAIRR